MPKTNFLRNVLLTFLVLLNPMHYHTKADYLAALAATDYDLLIIDPYYGGAVLTPEYAKMVGADYYAKDATASAKIAAEVLGQR